MANFNLSVGMNKEQVFQMAKNLGEAARTKVINFFDNDEDGKISHVNELAILNSIFDGTGKVKMPTASKQNNIGSTESDCKSKYPDGQIENWSLLYDEDGDGYADGHLMGHFDKKIGNKINGWSSKDANLDGVPDKKEPDNYVIDEKEKMNFDNAIKF